MPSRRGDGFIQPAVLAVAVASLLAGEARSHAQTTVYRDGFDGGAAEWSGARAWSVAGRTLLGRLHNQAVTLALRDLPGHGGVIVAFDLHVGGAWTGEPAPGSRLLPTRFTAALDDTPLLDSSLALDDGGAPRRQSFPDEPGTASHPASLGAYRVNALNLSRGGARTPDAVYRVVLSAAHGARSLVLSLKASGLPGGPDDAWWAIDNAVVQTVDDPGALDRAVDAARVAVARLEMGLGGLAPVAPEPVRAATHLLAPTLGHAGALEVAAALAPLGASRDGGTFLPSAVSGLPPTDLHIESPTLLTAAFAREHPAPALPSIAVVPFRAEQPVVRRVESLAYQSRFTSGVGPEWDAPSHGVAPRGERFVGPFGDGAATLRLSDLPEHDQLVIDADLYTIGDWPGNGPTPSRLTVTLDGKALMADTFAVEDGLLKRTQTYPSDGGRKRRIPAADAAAIDALGYPPVGDAAKGAAGDVTYHLRFVVPHTAGAGALRFAAQGLTAGAASWGLDNVTVVASGRRAMRFADATGMEPDDNADDGDYNNPFVRAPGPEWSVSPFEKSPSGEMYLGRLHNGAATLTVRNFPLHTHLVVAADVVVVGDWQGNAPDPSRFSVRLSDGTVLCATSFASDGGSPDATQDYPDTKPARNLPGAGAFSVGSLGYTDPRTRAPRDAVYRLLFTVPHTAAAEAITFAADGLRADDSAASWGLDNVVVSTFDAASPVAGGGGGMSLGDAGALAVPSGAGGGFGSGGAPLGNNPVITTPTNEPFPQVGGGGGGGGGGNNPPLTPAPGTVPALLVGLGIAAGRRRR